jgi:hypothetical protein
MFSLSAFGHQYLAMKGIPPQPDSLVQNSAVFYAACYRKDTAFPVGR